MEVFHLGYRFNQPIGKEVLPQSLRELHFGFFFHQPIAEDVLPTSLAELHYGHYDRQIEQNVLPPILTEFENW